MRLTAEQKSIILTWIKTKPYYQSMIVTIGRTQVILFGDKVSIPELEMAA